MRTTIVLTVLAALTALLYTPVARTVRIMGLLRTAEDSRTTRTVRQIEDTRQCEDLHYYAPAQQLFAACEDSTQPRFAWWPAMGTFTTPWRGRGSIHVIDATVRLRNLLKTREED